MALSPDINALVSVEETKEGAECLDTLVRPKGVKNNSLYNLIQNLETPSNNNKLLNAHKVKLLQNDNRNAYIIELPGQPKELLFDNFKCRGRHLTIDKWFAEANTKRGRKGCTAAHYTEQYYDASQNQKILHIFFDSQGNFAFAQINNVDKNSIIRIDSVDLENKALENANDAIALLKQLLELKFSLYFEAFNVSIKHQKALYQYSQNLSQAENRQAYIKTARLFLDIIPMLNSYNDNGNDVRTKFIGDFLEQVQQLEKRISEEEKQRGNPGQAAAVLPNNQDDKSAPDLAEPIAVAAKKDPLQEAVSEIAELKKQLEEMLQSKVQDTQFFMTVYNIAKTLKEKLIDFMCVTGLKSHQKFIANAEKALALLPDIQQTDIQQYFIECGRKGDFESIERIFPFTDLEHQFKVYLQSIKALCDPAVPEQLVPNHIRICQFLFKTSDVYKIYNANYVVRVAYNPEMEFTTLAQICVVDRLEAFSMLLEQEFNPNGIGIILNVGHQKIISPVTAVVACAKRPEFLQLILEYGGTPNIPVIPFSSKVIQVIPEEDLKAVEIVALKQSKHLKVNIQGKQTLASHKEREVSGLYKQLDDRPSELWVACGLERYQFVPTLIKEGTFGDYCFGLAALHSVSNFEIVHSFAAIPKSVKNIFSGVQFAQNLDKLQSKFSEEFTKAMQTAKKDEETILAYTQIFVPDPKQDNYRQSMEAYIALNQAAQKYITTCRQTTDLREIKAFLKGVRVGITYPISGVNRLAFCDAYITGLCLIGSINQGVALEMLKVLEIKVNCLLDERFETEELAIELNKTTGLIVNIAEVAELTDLNCYRAAKQSQALPQPNQLLQFQLKDDSDEAGPNERHAAHAAHASSSVIASPAKARPRRQ